jgi:hypothetical protein
MLIGVLEVSDAHVNILSITVFFGNNFSFMDMLLLLLTMMHGTNAKITSYLF